MNLKSRYIILVSMVVLYAIQVNNPLKAQSYQEGTLVINAGIGFPGSVRYLAGAGVKHSPVLTCTGEYGLKKLGPGILGVGLAFGYQSASYTYHNSSYYYKDKWATTLIGLRASYHPDFLNGDKYDVYGVVQLSFDHFGYTFSSDDPYYNTYAYGRGSLENYVRPYLMVGGRYYFNRSIGVFGEVGYDIAYFKMGFSFKLDTR